MFRKQNQKRVIILASVLLALLLVLLTVVLILNGIDSSENTEDGIVICKSDLFSVQKITYEYQGETVRLARENGMWMLTGEPDFPLNQSRLISTSQLCMAYKGANITFSRKVADTCPDLATFGLDRPTLKVTVESLEKDQTVTRTLSFGIAYGTSNYYCMLQGDPALYLIDASYVQVFSYTKNDLANRDYLPAVAENMIVDYTYTDGETAYWVLSDAGIKAIYAHLNTISFDTFADYSATEAELQDFFPTTKTLRIRYYKVSGDQKLLPPVVSDFELHLGATKEGGVCFKVWYRNAVYYTTPAFAETLLSLLEEHNGENALPDLEADRIIAYTYQKGETLWNVSNEAGIAAIHAHLKGFAFDRVAQGDASLEARFPKEEEAFLVINYYRTEADKTASTPVATPYVLQFGNTEDGGVCVRVWYQDQVYYADEAFTQTLLDLMEQHQDVEEEEEEKSE